MSRSGGDMITTKRMELLNERAEYISDIEKVAVPASDLVRIIYKVNNNAGKETIELKYKNGVIRRKDVTGKTRMEILKGVVNDL